MEIYKKVTMALIGMCLGQPSYHLVTAGICLVPVRVMIYSFALFQRVPGTLLRRRWESAVVRVCACVCVYVRSCVCVCVRARACAFSLIY